MILHFHKPDPTNLGDLMSNPFLYFNFENVSTHDITEYNQTDPVDKHLVFGGGGLIGHRKMGPMIQHVSNHPGAKSVTFWGAGHNFTADQQHLLYPDYLKRANLIGIRDYINQEHWVPCASCMHSSLDKSQTVTQDIVIYTHKKISMNLKNPRYPVMSNAAENFESIMNFLGSAETVITNSYHGAYWSLLLGKRVKLFNWNIKFDYFREPMDFVDNIEAVQIEPFTKNDSILELYRDRNREFAQRFSALINAPIVSCGPNSAPISSLQSSSGTVPVYGSTAPDQA